MGRGGWEASATKVASLSRKQYLPAEDVEKVIGFSPDAEWRLIIALSRFAGLRCPSETLKMKWSDVDWEQNRMTVHSKKTAKQGKPHRMIPIFTKLRLYLEEAFEAAEEGVEHIIGRYRDSETNLRTQLHRYIRKAGLEPWQRAFHQMRASCQTDLERHHGLHAAAAWLGNSPSVAAEHYLSVHPDAFAAASGAGGGNCRCRARPRGPAASRKTRKTTCRNLLIDNGFCETLRQETKTGDPLRIAHQYTPQGSNL